MTMGSDSASISSGYASSKKNKTNRSAKSKQGKFGVLRSQRNSNAKNKIDEADSIQTGLDKIDGRPENLQSKRGEEKHDNEPVLLTSRSADNGCNHGVPSRDGVERINSNRNNCFSGSSSDEEKQEEALDDWEAVADALSTENVLPSTQDMKISTRSEICKLDNHDMLQGSVEANNALRRPLHQSNNSAWRPGDVFRAQSLPCINTNYARVVKGTLPGIVKQQARVVNSGRGGGYGGGTWSWRRRTVAPEQSTSCPICCEDLDLTDRSFRPCPCGFQVCLFCHKRIREDDGRCPGCRKPYEAIYIETYYMARAHLGMCLRFMS